ncbi:MAG: 4'-phosphopantetheinyl transferase superfamily protein, partial [Bacteroidota bacterium]
LPSQVAFTIHNFSQHPRKLSFMLGRLMLSKMLDIDLTSIQLGRYGKPSLPNGFHFNISYSNDLIICAISENYEIGVDVEYIKSDIVVDDYLSVLNENDGNLISNSYNAVETFYRVWTAKESVMKADGRGFNIGMDNIELHDNYALIANESKKWHLRWLEPMARYQLAVCCEEDVDVELRSFDLLDTVG